MRVGDVLEWVAAACFVTATGLATGLAWPALVVAGVCVAYFAQCYAEESVPRVRLPRVSVPRPDLSALRRRFGSQG